jgi:hypothetical protein
VGKLNKEGGIAMRLCALTLGFMLMVGSAFGAGIDGNWAGTMDVMGQQIEVKYTFKVDGDILTGTTAGQDGRELEIKNGKIGIKRAGYDDLLYRGYRWRPNYHESGYGYGTTHEVRYKKGRIIETICRVLD